MNKKALKQKLELTQFHHATFYFLLLDLIYRISNKLMRIILLLMCLCGPVLFLDLKTTLLNIIICYIADIRSKYIIFYSYMKS